MLHVHADLLWLIVGHEVVIFARLVRVIASTVFEAVVVYGRTNRSCEYRHIIETGVARVLSIVLPISVLAVVELWHGEFTSSVATGSASLWKSLSSMFADIDSFYASHSYDDLKNLFGGKLMS